MHTIPYRIFTAILLCIIGVSFTVPAHARSVEELRTELNSKRRTLQESERKIEEFRSGIQEKRQEARTLADQIDLIEDSIEEIQLTINRTTAEVAKMSLEIETVEKEIEIKEQDIENQKRLLADYIRAIHELDQQSSIAIFLKYQTFSEALNETATIEDLQRRGHEALIGIQALRHDLVTKRRELSDFKQSLEALQSRQEQQQSTLDNQRASKQRILDLTNEQEAQYSELLQEAQRAHQESQSAIQSLDARIREELRRQGHQELPSVGMFDWPIQPIFGISCEFRCGGYPYQHLIGPHSAIDIPTYVGTPIKAPADGYVARNHDSGGPGYSYIMLVHGGGLTTIYGHVSGFAVNEGQYVTRGTVIGYTGGAPGSRGAGLSTGPHLHFEVRLNNVPVNPRNYLP